MAAISLWFCALALLLAGMLLPAAAVQAEPYFSVRDGYKCSKCHINKTGGHTRTEYAKVYVETRSAMTGGAEPGTVSDVGHGRLSDFLAIGADLRAGIESRDFLGKEDEWNFGRQTCASCHASGVSGGGGGKRAEVYVQMQPMPGKASIVIAENLVPGPTTREAYGLVELGWLNGYVKAGLFRMPTAFRNTFDDPFIHDVLSGSTTVVGLVPVRGDGVEVGIEPGPFTVSLSLTNSASAAVLKDKRLHLNAAMVGRLGMVGLVYYADPVSPTLDRTYTGLYGGASVGRFTGLLEVDAYTESDPSGAGAEIKKQSLLAQLDLLLSRGQNLKWQYESLDPDTGTDLDIRDRTSLIYEPFLTPYLQFRGGARRWAGPRQDPSNNGTTLFVEMHLIY